MNQRFLKMLKFFYSYAKDATVLLFIFLEFHYLEQIHKFIMIIIVIIFNFINH